MIIEEAVLNFLEFRVQDKQTLLWDNLAADALSIKIQRGGNISYGGLITVDAGVASIRVKYPVTEYLEDFILAYLSPQTKIQVYNTTFTDPNEGSVFIGTIDDIDSEYKFNLDLNITEAFVTIIASDSIASHTNTSVIGITTTNGFERWEERIATLEPYSISEIVIPTVDADILIYSI